MRAVLRIVIAVALMVDFARAASPYAAQREGNAAADAALTALPARSGCPSRIGNNVYRCSVLQDSGSTFEDCFRFVTPGVLSAKFDLATDGLGDTVGCTCGLVWRGRRVRFNAASTFVCTGTAGISFLGTVSGDGRRISHGLIFNDGGGEFAYQCIVDPSCTPQ